MRDLEYERQLSGSASYERYIPEPVKKFLAHFRDMIAEGNAFEIANLYENGFPKLTDQFFKTSTWPEAEIVAP